MEEVFDQRATRTLGIMTEAIGAMGLLGLILAMVGLYGLMSYSVSLRSREIGIRMAIGAGRSGVLGMVMKQGMVLAAAGVVNRSAALRPGEQGVHRRFECAIVQFAICRAGDGRASRCGGAGRVCPGTARVASGPECRPAARIRDRYAGLVADSAGSLHDAGALWRPDRTTLSIYCATMALSAPTGWQTTAFW